MGMKPGEYPLAWPKHIPRWEKTRQSGQFRTELKGAIKNVRGELQKFANLSGKSLSGIVISTNVTLATETPSDPGVSVWFTWDGVDVVIPVDRYSTVKANMQAIAHVLDARNTELRHGTLALVKASFEGLRALPVPDSSIALGGPNRSPWEILGVPASAKAEAVQKAWRDKQKGAAGNEALQRELNVARDTIIQRLNQAH